MPKTEVKNEEQVTDNVKNQEVKSVPVVKTKKKVKASKKEKKQRKGLRWFKEMGSELKKVSWPTFGKVCKQTGVVLAVVLIFGVVLFGFDFLLKYLFDLLV